jgi:hypothetical protein
MRVIGPSSEDEMIVAFLQAELRSGRYGSLYPQIAGYDREQLVFEPRLDDVVENDLRRRLLTSIRGFANRTLLFINFANDVDWLRVAYTIEEVGTMKYANFPTWNTLSKSTRRVRDGAANVGIVATDEETQANVEGVQLAIAEGHPLAPTIVVAERRDASPVVVEGHTRVTAYVRGSAAGEEIEAILGVSPLMARWHWF